MTVNYACLFFNDNDVCFLRHLVNYALSFKDNRDNRNNKKNGRNCGCHEVTYNWDNKITVGSSQLHLIF